MKLFKKLSLILLSVLVIAGSAFIFTGCEEKSNVSKLYVFATEGGYVQVADNEDVVRFGDEGSKVFTYKLNDSVKLTAIPEDGYRFVKWRFTELMESEYSSIANQAECEIKLKASEVVIKAEFEIVNQETSSIYQVYTEDDRFTILEIGHQDGKASWDVVEGTEFNFMIVLDSDYVADGMLKVMCDGIEISAEQEIYSIEVHNTMKIDVENIVEKDPLEVYEFTLKLDARIETQASPFVPEKIQLKIKQSEKTQEYLAQDVIVIDTAFGEEHTLKEIIDVINNANALLKIESFSLVGGDVFITVLDSGVIVVDWTMISSLEMYYTLEVNMI